MEPAFWASRGLWLLRKDPEFWGLWDGISGMEGCGAF